MIKDLDRYLSAMGRIHPAGSAEPRILVRARAVRRVLAGESVGEVSAQTGLPKRYLAVWAEAIQGDEGLYGWLGKQTPKTERVQRARQGIVQMLLGTLAETHFEALSAKVLGPQGFAVEDQRIGRSDTDYRLLDANGRPICRFNIKFHGTLFRESHEYVGLEPSDCFALATYKIHGALRRQQDERLPYVFLIISVPDVPRSAIEDRIPGELAWLASLSGRAIEEAIVGSLLSEPWTDDIRTAIRGSEFRIISARRAYSLLRDHLFERVHALRLRAFGRTFRSAEINMHLSLSKEMITFTEFLSILAHRGALELTVRLDRGEI